MGYKVKITNRETGETVMWPDKDMPPHDFKRRSEAEAVVEDMTRVYASLARLMGREQPVCVVELDWLRSERRERSRPSRR